MLQRRLPLPMVAIWLENNQSHIQNLCVFWQSPISHSSHFRQILPLASYHLCYQMALLAEVTNLPRGHIRIAVTLFTITNVARGFKSIHLILVWYSGLSRFSAKNLVWHSIDIRQSYKHPLPFVLPIYLRVILALLGRCLPLPSSCISKFKYLKNHVRISKYLHGPGTSTSCTKK